MTSFSPVRATWMLLRLHSARRRSSGAAFQFGSVFRIALSLGIAALSFRCFQTFKGIAKHLGAEGVHCRTALFSSLNIESVLLVALAGGVPIFALQALIADWHYLVKAKMSRSRMFRVLQRGISALGVVLFVGWLGAMSIDGLRSLPGVPQIDVVPFGSWLSFSDELGWLPFSEPARTLFAWRESWPRALVWASLFAVDVGFLLGLVTYKICKLSGLSQGA